MPYHSWKNWTLFILGLCTLLVPYSGFPQPIKNVFLILVGITITCIAASFLWPYLPRKKPIRTTSSRRTPRMRSAHGESDAPQTLEQSFTSVHARSDEVVHEAA